MKRGVTTDGSIGNKRPRAPMHNTITPNREYAAPAGSLGTRRERWVLLVLAAAQFTNLVDFMVVMPLGPDMMSSLGIDPGQFGLIVSAYAFAAGVAGLVGAAFMDRFTRKAAFITLYTGFMIGTLLCGLAPTYATLLAARIVTGAFGGVLGGLSMTIIGDVFPEHRRGRATGVLMSAFSLASVVGVPAGIELGQAWGWHAPFLVLAALGSPVLLLTAWAMPTLPPHRAEGPRRRPLRMIFETLTLPTHLKAFALIITIMLGSFAVIPYVSTYLVRNVGVSEVNLKWVFVTSGLCAVYRAPGRPHGRSLRQDLGLSRGGAGVGRVDGRDHPIAARGVAAGRGRGGGPDGGQFQPHDRGHGPGDG